MSDVDKIQLLNERLRQFEARPVPDWQRGIVEVARQALLQEIAALGRQVERWQR
jgi:hypothetical protein